MKKDSFSLLALGDSYTIGESVKEEERWPSQLADLLLADSIHLSTEIVATTGWTTDELLKGIMASDLKAEYDLVSLLVGVNNQYRGYEMGQYEREFKKLLDEAVGLAGGNPHHVFVISIPDYGVTPFARNQSLDPEKIATELHEYNAIAEKISTLRDVQFISITEQSRQALENPGLIASDGLHPSGKMYQTWADEIYPQVKASLLSR